MRSATPIIAQEQGAVNSCISTPREIAKARAQARKRVRKDGKLTFGARCFYDALDDWGMSAGATELKRAEMAAGLETSTRSITDWTAELLERGYISQERGRNGSRLLLFWKHPRSEDTSLLKTPEVKILPPRSEDTSLLAVQDMPSLTPKQSIKGSKGGWVNTALPSPKPPQPARLESSSDELARNLRACGYQPDPPLIRRLAALIPEGCTVPVAVAVLRRRITRPRSKPLKQAMLPIFFTEDIPAKWQAEARELEVRQQIERARHPVIDEAAERRQAQEILRRPDSDRIELEWAHMVLDGGAMAATA